MTTYENQGSNSRGCHTEYNGSLGLKSIAKCIVDIGLASSTRAMKKKQWPEWLLTACMI
jgi:hypothetical protein